MEILSRFGFGRGKVSKAPQQKRNQVSAHLSQVGHDSSTLEETKSKTIIHEEENFQKLYRKIKNDPTREANLPLVSELNEAEMEIYRVWFEEQREMIIEMKVDIKAPVRVNSHRQKGGIIYLEPFGIYFFPTLVFHLLKDGKRVPSPSPYGFWLDASHCKNPKETDEFIRKKVAVNDEYLV